MLSEHSFAAQGGLSSLPSEHGAFFSEIKTGILDILN